MASELTLSSLAALAASSSTMDDDDTYTINPTSSRDAPKTKEQLRRHYIRALHKVIDESDIIVLVLDARDPEGCRSRLVEEEVRRRESEGKRLVFVLNKVGEYGRSGGHLPSSTIALPFLLLYMGSLGKSTCWRTFVYPTLRVLSSVPSVTTKYPNPSSAPPVDL